MDDALKARLKELGLSDEQVGKLETEGGATGEADVVLLTAPQIREVTGCTLVASIRVAQAFQPAPPPVVEAPIAAGMPSLDTLPMVPDDTSFLEMLRVGGILKISPTEVIAAIRAAIADNVGLYNLPELIKARMEQHANELEEPVSPSFFTLQKLIARRNYGEVLSALDVPGDFVSDKRKGEVLTKLRTLLWPALIDFNAILQNWSRTWMEGAASPTLILQALTFAQVGGPRPPGMLQTPDTAGIRDQAEGVINRINKVFAGTGIPVARALAYDATRIRTILEDPTLPATIGATTRDEMIRKLGVNVGPENVRLERNVTRFALAIMELPKVTSGPEEYGYLSAMLTLGNSIPWESLVSSESRVTRIPGRGRGEEVSAASGDRFPRERAY